MIVIHIGVLEAEPQLGKELVRKPQDYIGARLAIRQALQAGQDLEVYVEARTCDDWFWDLESHPSVRVSREDPSLLLRQRLRVPALPPEIDDPVLINALRLMDLPEPQSPIQDVGRWIAGQKLGKVWETLQPSYEHLRDLVSWWSRNTVPQSLRPLAGRILRGWGGSANRPLRDAYEEVNKDPSTSALFLGSWQVLRGYDDVVRENWLREAGWYLPQLKPLADILECLPLPALANTVLSPKVEAYWTRRLVELEAELDK